MKFYKKVLATLAYYSICREARLLQMKDGQRRFVVPFADGKMDVLTKEEALALKKNGQLAKDLTAKTLYGACFFFTGTNDSTASVKCEMPKLERNRRRQFFYSWFDRHHS